ncbi:MAG: S8 family serine peptidase [Myxococcota bacterium]|nr:S8 family serine peptidase [Myxococcota bacterium]
MRGAGIIDSASLVRRFSGSHGTSVASIAVGGQLGYHSQVGVAPNADYLLYSTRGGANREELEGHYLDSLAEARLLNATLFLHELSQIIFPEGDGSSNYERLISQQSEEGLSHVCPLGNLNRSGKHFEALHRQETFQREWTTPDQFGGEPVRVNQIRLSWRTPTDSLPRLRLTLPGGREAIELPEPGEARALPLPNHYAYHGFSLSEGGTYSLILYVYIDRESPDALRAGNWRIMVDGLPPQSMVTGRIVDDQTSWSGGATWRVSTDDRGSLTLPSTSVGAIGVAAYGGMNNIQGPSGGLVGALRGYSGRGPTIDGRHFLGIGAPDDPYAAHALSIEAYVAGEQSARFQTFGGTSGAGPHVAGALALLAEQHPEWESHDREARLLERAIPIEGDAAERRAWGSGKLNIHQLLHGEPALPLADPPSPSISLHWGDSETLLIDASESLAAEPGLLAYRFDIGYDGEWESDWTEEPIFQWPEPPPASEEEVEIKLLVRSASGAFAGVVYQGPVPEQLIEADIGVLDLGADQAPADLGTLDAAPADQDLIDQADVDQADVDQRSPDQDAIDQIIPDQQIADQGEVDQGPSRDQSSSVDRDASPQQDQESTDITPTDQDSSPPDQAGAERGSRRSGGGGCNEQGGTPSSLTSLFLLFTLLSPRRRMHHTSA